MLCDVRPALDTALKRVQTEIVACSGSCGEMQSSPETGDEHWEQLRMQDAYDKEHMHKPRLAAWFEHLQLVSTELAILPPNITDRRTFYVYILSDKNESVLARRPTSMAGGKEYLSSDGQEGEILRDVPRTMHDHILFQGRNSAGQHMLANVLRAVLHACPCVGYCQGMNLVAAALLVSRAEQQSEAVPQEDGWQIDVTDELLALAADVDNSASGGGRGDGARLGVREEGAGEDKEEDTDAFDDVHNDADGAHTRPSWAHKCVRKAFVSNSTALDVEADVFWLMVSMITSPRLSMGDLWQPGIPAVTMRSFQADQLLQEELPDVHQRLQQIGLPSEMLTTQWLMTLFAYVLPLDMTLDVWDYIFREGWPGVFSVVLALFQHLKPVLDSNSMDEFGARMRFWREHGVFVDCASPELIRTAQNFAITNERLAALQEVYSLKLIRQYQPCSEQQRSTTTQEDEFRWLFQQHDPLQLMRTADRWNLRFGLSLFRHVFSSEAGMLEQQLREIGCELDDVKSDVEQCAAVAANALEGLRKVPTASCVAPASNRRFCATAPAGVADWRGKSCGNSSELLELLDWVLVDHLQNSQSDQIRDFDPVSHDRDSIHTSSPATRPTRSNAANSLRTTLLWLLAVPLRPSEQETPFEDDPATLSVGQATPPSRHCEGSNFNQVTSGIFADTGHMQGSPQGGVPDPANAALCQAAQQLQRDYEAASQTLHALLHRLEDLQASKTTLAMRLLHSIREAARRFPQLSYAPRLS